MGFPVHRLRRLRKNETMRSMVRESSFGAHNLIYPLFVVHGNNVRKEISSLPGNFHLSIDRLGEEIRQIRDLGIPGVLLFGVPKSKDNLASEAYDFDGIVQRAVKEIKDVSPETAVITDVCFCAYTEHGHCGIMKDGYLQNDQSLELISKVTLTHAQAGADMVAPAAMLDGQIRAMRTVLDQNGFSSTAIMAYSAKFASRLYDLFFKHGSGGVLSYGDKKTHQMDYANSDEAMREIAFDIEEGADIVLVKPALFYLDIVYRAKQEFGVPLGVYNVSGEYAMLKSFAEASGTSDSEMCKEIITAFRRAGADLIISYHAREIAQRLRAGDPLWKN